MFPAALSSSHLVPHLQIVVVLSFLITKTISEAVSPLLSPYDVQIGGESIRIITSRIESMRRQGGAINISPSCQSSVRMTLAMLVEPLGLGILPPQGWTEMERGCL